MNFNTLIQVEVRWAATPCNVAVRHQRFGGPCCLHPQGEVRDAGK
jgi:hypothetical protein